jgi:hypothetical protein
MTKVNASDRASLMRAYPRDLYAQDAAQNERGSNEIIKGVRISSAPDADGWFDVEPSNRHIGEPPSPQFLAPTRRRAELTHQGRASEDSAAPEPDLGYEQFLDGIIAAARQHGFRPEQAPGRDEPRLRGFRGG